MAVREFGHDSSTFQIGCATRACLFIVRSLSSRCCVTDRSVHSRPLTSFDTFHFESSLGRVLCLKIETESFVGIIVLLAVNVSFCVARLTV